MPLNITNALPSVRIGARNPDTSSLCNENSDKTYPDPPCPTKFKLSVPSIFILLPLIKSRKKSELFYLRTISLGQSKSISFLPLAHSQILSHNALCAHALVGNR